MKPLSTVLIKPAGPDCNLGCVYCFYRPKEALFPGGEPRRMSESVLAALTEQVLRDGAESVTFCWQGGEPTLMGLDFYRTAVALQRKHARPGQRVANALQTNGWLIDDAWSAFLREHGFLVGLSLDGPAAVHDRCRVTLGGEPTHARVVRAAERLLRGGVATNALVVVHGGAVGHGREIYHFLRELGFAHLQFIPCLAAGEPWAIGDPQPCLRAPPSSAESRTHHDGPGPFEALTSDGWGDFLIEIFEAWREECRDGWPTVYVRHLEALFAAYVGAPPLDCTLAETCGDYLVVEHNGDVFACDFFVTPEWRLGNVLSDRLTDLLNSPRQREFGRRKRALPDECQSCRWLPQCRGGCPAERDAQSGGFRLCEGYRRFLEHADPLMRRLATRWRREPSAQGQHLPTSLRVAPVPQETPGAPLGRNAPCPCGSGRKFKNCCGR